MKGLIQYVFLVITLLITGCSGGGSSANAVLNMTLSSATVVAGGSISSTTQLVATASRPVNNIDVIYTSSRPDLIHFATNTATNTGFATITVQTNVSGAAYVVLNVDNSVAIPLEGVKVSISASAQGLTSTQQLTVTAIQGGGGQVGGTKIQLALDKTTISDNSGQTVATATVTDAAGAALAGQVVTFSISPATGPANFVAINGGVTDSSGKAYATITGTTTATTQNIFVYAAVSGISAAKPLTVVPSSTTTPSSTPKNITLLLAKTSLQASEQSILTATVTDGNNLPIANQKVDFSITQPGVHATVAAINSGATDSSGKAYAIVTATIATAKEDVIVFAATGVSPDTVTGSVPISILPPGSTSTTLPAAKVSMVADKTSIQPGGQALITATITDAAGVVVPNEVVTFSAVTGVTLVTPANVTTGSDGKVLAIFQASAASNPTYALIKATTANGATQTISLGVLPIGKPQLTLTIAKQTIEATDKEILATVTVLDSTGAPVNGQSVTFSIVSGPATLDPALLTVITGIDGKASTKLTPVATAFESNILLSMQLSYQAVSYSLVSTALVNPAVKITVALDSATVDTVGQLIATATATTAAGTALPGQVVTFNITGPGKEVGSSTTTASDGTAKSIITHDGTTTIGNIIVEASITYGGTTYTAYATAIPKVANMKLQLSAQSGFPGAPGVGSISDSNTATVDALTSGLPLKATLTYLDGTPVPNQVVTFTALDAGIFWNSAAAAAQNGGVVTSTTTMSGEAYAVAVPGNFPVSGYVHIQASVTINGATYTQVMPIKVMGSGGGGGGAGTSSTQIQKSLSLDKSAITVAPGATGSLTATYNLKNSTGDPVSGQAVVWSILSGSATFSGGATTDGNGDAIALIQTGAGITTTTEVYVQAAVTIGGVTYNSVASFTVKPSISLELATDLVKVDQTIGAVVATASLKDAAGNPVAGQGVTFDILTPNAVIATAATMTSVDGTAKATITPGAVDFTQNVLVRVQTVIAGVSYQQVTSFQIIRGQGVLTLSTLDSDAAVPLSETTHTFYRQIPFTLTDSNGNPRINMPVTLSIQSQLGSAAIVIIGAPTVTSDAAGKGVFNVSVTLTNNPGNKAVSSVVYMGTTTDGIIVFGGEQYSTSSDFDPLTATPASLSFIAGAANGDTLNTTISGGKAGYTASSNAPAVITAAIVGNKLTVTKLANVLGTYTVTVTDSAGKVISVTVSVL